MLHRLLLPLLALGLTACSGAEGRSWSTDPPRKGECRVLTPADIQRFADDTAPTDCSERHTAETFATGTFPEELAGDDIDDAALGAHLFSTCERKLRRHLGGDQSAVMRSTVTWSWFRPTAAAWDDGARWWRCDVVGGGEQSTRLVELPETTKGLLLGRPSDRWVACVDGPTVAGSAKIPCSDEHTWRAVTTIVLGDPQDPYPGDDAVRDLTRDYCSDSVGAWLEYPVDYDYAYTYFHETEWEAGNRRSVCWARTSK